MSDSTRHLTSLFAVTALLAGFGVLVLQMVDGYGSAGSGDYAERGQFVLPLFLSFWMLHVVAYLPGRRVGAGSQGAALYLVAQLALIVGATLASGRAVGVLVFYVVWGAQAVVLFQRRWPFVVITGGTVALIAMSRNPTEAPQIVAIVTILILIVMTTYVVSHVRTTLARREARDLLNELSTTSNELSGYASEVEEAALLSERQRMARELHDTLAQGLVGVTLQLEAADAHLEKGGTGRAREIVTEAMARARETLIDARKAIHDLREEGDSGALDDVIRRETARFSRATGIDCDLVARVDETPSAEVAEVIKCVVTEALTNAARHSGAVTVNVYVHSDVEGASVCVSDDGIGMQQNGANERGHYGLIGLRERARKIGGQIILESKSGTGTTVRFTCHHRSHQTDATVD